MAPGEQMGANPFGTVDLPFDWALARSARASRAAVSLSGLTVTFAEIHGRRVLFATDAQRDPIQRTHREGAFYEVEELEMIRQHLRPGATFVDVGANVGNHALYACLFLGASRVIAFEPNPRAYRLLVANVLLNDCERFVDLSHLGMGLSDRANTTFGFEAREANLGATRLVEGEGDVECSTGDAELAGEAVDFIKIDVEGMELSVLRGLEETIRRCRPVLFVEVLHRHEADFAAWLQAMGYAELSRFRRWKSNVNILAGPIASGDEKEGKTDA